MRAHSIQDIITAKPCQSLPSMPGSNLYIIHSSEKVRNLLFNLAKQEIDHIIRIDDIFNAVHQNRPWPQIYQGEITNVGEEMKKVFNRLDRKAREEKLDNIKSYQLAIDFEKQSYQMYKEFSENVTDESQKRFFVSLAEEEKKALKGIR